QKPVDGGSESRVAGFIQSDDARAESVGQSLTDLAECADRPASATVRVSGVKRHKRLAAARAAALKQFLELSMLVSRNEEAEPFVPQLDTDLPQHRFITACADSAPRAAHQQVDDTRPPRRHHRAR